MGGSSPVLGAGLPQVIGEDLELPPKLVDGRTLPRVDELDRLLQHRQGQRAPPGSRATHDRTDQRAGSGMATEESAPQWVMAKEGKTPTLIDAIENCLAAKCAALRSKTWRRRRQRLETRPGGVRILHLVRPL